MLDSRRSRHCLSLSPCLTAFLLLLVTVAAQAQVLVPNLIYTTVKPCRIFDTRHSTGGKLMGGTAQTVVLAVRQDTQGGDISVEVAVGNVDAFGDIVGYFSADSITPVGAFGNVLLGAGAGNQGSSSATGSDNVGIGYAALAGLTDGGENVAIGRQSSAGITSGSGNAAVGFIAMNTLSSGNANTAVGDQALINLETGSANIAIGELAGEALLTTESFNIDIGNSGVVSDSETIRIGSSQTATFVAGIHGSTSSSGLAVFVNSSGQLGTATSSARFKDDVQDMGAASDKLMQLRPVTFHYKPQYDDGSHLLQYGLVAEEVAKVYPGLVQYDEDGRPLAVRYQFVDAMLLNAVQLQRNTIADQQGQIDQLKSQLADLQQALRALTQPPVSAAP